MKRRGFLQRSAALSTIGLPNLSANDKQILSTDDIDTTTDFLSNDRLDPIEPTNPGRGPTSLNNRVGVENIDNFDDGVKFAKRVLDPEESPSLTFEPKRQSLVQYIGVQEKEMDVEMHYFGVDEDRALLINSFIEDAFPRLDLNIETNDVMNQWSRDNIASLFDIGTVKEPFSYDNNNLNTVYADGMPEDRLSVEERYGSSDRVDIFVFNGSHTHGYGSPGGSAWIEVEPAEDLADEVRNVRTSVHEAGHAVYGLPHHLTVGAMSYNGRMINDFVDNNEAGEFLEFGDYSQVQIERTLNGSIELEETDLGHALVYEAEDRDPEDYTAEFLDNMTQYMEQVTRIALDDPDKKDVEWTGLDAEYTDEMDIARLNVDGRVVELGVHKADGFRHEDAYAERIS